MFRKDVDILKYRQIKHLKLNIQITEVAFKN